MSDLNEFQGDHYDLIAIGSGPAGESAVELASTFGHRCLIIEKGKPGGVVTTTGGAPTKTLREAALYFSGFRDRDVYGLRLEASPEVVLDTIRKRTTQVSETLQRLTFERLSQCGVAYLEGTARLGPKRTVVVALENGRERKLSATAILIATGSRPVRPSEATFDHPGICDTDSILERGRPPKSLIIVGGGAVGVEFATIAHALDIPVLLINRADRLLTMMDAEITERLTGLFRQRGIRVLGDCTVREIVPNGDDLNVRLSRGQTEVVDTVLFAAGRVPNTEDLGLEAAGVNVDSRGRILVDSQFRTTCDGVFAAGDVLGPSLASIAMEQGRSMACHAFGIPFEGTISSAPVSAVYGMPEIAGAGLTEDECREKRLDYEVGRSELDATPRGLIAGRGGLLKLIFLNESRRLVGVHAICDIASEIVGFGQMAIHCGATLNTIMSMAMNTPTYGYAYKYAAMDGLRKLIGRPEARRLR